VTLKRRALGSPKRPRRGVNQFGAEERDDVDLEPSAGDPRFEDIEEAFNLVLDESLDPRGPDMLYDMAAALGLSAESSILDLGCGTGKHSIRLARRFGATVVGVDPDQESLEAARRSLDDASTLNPDLGVRVRFVPGSAEVIPLDDADVDLVWCRDVLCLVADLDLAYSEVRRVMTDHGRAIVYQMFATDRLEPMESAQLFAALDCVPSSMDPQRVEGAIAGAGLQIDECVVLGTEWGENIEEESGKAGRLLLHAGRLLRDRDRYVERFGQRNYEIKLGDCMWHVYRLLGKLSGQVYVLTKT